MSDDINEIDALDAAVFSGDLLESEARRTELEQHIARWQRALANRWQDQDGVTSPPEALRNAVFALTFTGEGAAAWTVYGWEALVVAVKDAVGDHADWAELLADEDAWNHDDDGKPFWYSSRFEITNMNIYRIMEGQP